MTADGAGVVEIDGPLSRRKLRATRSEGPIARLSIDNVPVFSARMAEEIARWPAIGELDIRAHCTKAAFRRIVEMDGLRHIQVLGLTPHGSLAGMGRGRGIEHVDCMGLSAGDAFEMTGLTDLRSVRWQLCSLGHATAERLSRLEKLAHLDLEGARLTDETVESLARSGSLESLSLCNTAVSRDGLLAVARMTGLRELDLWATDIDADDLDVLQSLPSLEWLSVGGFEDQKRLTADAVLPRLFAFPALRRVWLDGIACDREQIAALDRRLEAVQIT